MRKVILLIFVSLILPADCVSFAQPAADPTGAAVTGDGEAIPIASIGVTRFEQLHRIKDIAFYRGERDNVVEGIGLVTGLAGTGGRSQQTRTLAENYLLRQGIALQRSLTQSFSVVFVRATIPPDARTGGDILATVAVADDATSLRGGVLIRTMLRGIDGQIYAEASGPLVAAGLAAGGAAASVQRDHPTVAECRGSVEREIHCDPVVIDNHIHLIVRQKDHLTAVSIANAIDEVFDDGTARAIDSGTIAVHVPPFYRNKLTDFQSIIGMMRVRIDQPARVVINQKTGTIVLGQSVRISNVVFGNETLIISKTETPIASQPAPFSDGDTVVLPRTSVDILETGGNYNSFSSGTTVGELANALNQLGVSPNLLITVFTSLEKQGALQARLVIQ